MGLLVDSCTQVVELTRLSPGEHWDSGQDWARERSAEAKKSVRNATIRRGLIWVVSVVGCVQSVVERG